MPRDAETLLEDAERVSDARALYRRGFCWHEALQRVGLPLSEFPYTVHVTDADDTAHIETWLYPERRH